MGRHTKYGGYVIEWNKVRTYAVPPKLEEFKVGVSDINAKDESSKN
jgi:large subunit ribosomal protein L41